MIGLWVRYLGLESPTNTALGIHIKSQRPSPYVGPFESVYIARTELDNLCMCTNSLLFTDKMLEISSIINEVRESPILNELVCGGWLKISLGKRHYAFKDLTNRE